MFSPWKWGSGRPATGCVPRPLGIRKGSLEATKHRPPKQASAQGPAACECRQRSHRSHDVRQHKATPGMASPGRTPPRRFADRRRRGGFQGPIALLVGEFPPEAGGQIHPAMGSGPRHPGSLWAGPTGGNARPAPRLGWLVAARGHSRPGPRPSRPAPTAKKRTAGENQGQPRRT